LILCHFCAFAQLNEYGYKRELKGISTQWHTIQLPDDIFRHLNENFSDIRIYGLTPEQDTVEAPYLLRIAADKIDNRTVQFKTINQSSNENGYYFTFEIPTVESVNQLQLDFKQENFDWRIKLEGSQNQQDWFTVLNDYRILSIKNESTNFKFTSLNFPDIKFRFLRLSINSLVKPELLFSSIASQQTIPGNSRSYKVKEFTATEKKDTRQTLIDLELEYPVPVSSLEIKINDTVDYYRPITMQYLSDSVKTEQGWIFNYQSLLSGTLNSFEKQQWVWESRLVRKLRVVIDNQDNQALSVGEVVLKGYVHELLARFTIPGTYALYYGNKKASRPAYDLNHFTDKVPVEAQLLDMGPELKTLINEPPAGEPLFANKLWLWIVMGVIIVLLGVLTFNMITKK
jgi:hypothetical protein